MSNDFDQSTGLATPHDVSDTECQFRLRQLDGLHPEDPLIVGYWAKIVPIFHPDKEEDPEAFLIPNGVTKFSVGTHGVSRAGHHSMGMTSSKSFQLSTISYPPSLQFTQAQVTQSRKWTTALP